jgi:hypothetical protein
MPGYLVINISTVTVRKPDMSGIQMVRLCPKVKWSGFLMVLNNPISGPVFRWSAKLDHFTQKKNTLCFFSHITV